MNEYNCNSLKNLSVPDDLVNKALGIPGIERKNSASVPAIMRRWAAAAVVVLVFTAGFTVYFLTRNISRPQILPSPTSAVTEAGIYPTVSDDVTSPTDDRHAHSEAGSEPHTTQPTIHSSTQSTAKPTDGHTDLPTEPPVKPTIAPTDKPTEPTEVSTDPPIEAPTAEPWYNSFEALIGKDRLTGSGKVYCAIYDSSGDLLGGGNPLSADRQAELYDYGDFVYAVYTPYIGFIPYADNYTVVFYNESGSILVQYSRYLYG